MADICTLIVSGPHVDVYNAQITNIIKPCESEICVMRIIESSVW